MYISDTRGPAAAALCVFLGAPAAMADVTAEQVWAEWRDYMTDAGYQVDALDTRSGDTLTISDLVMSMAVPEDDSTVTVSMGDMAFVDKGDGTVSIELPQDMPIGITVTGPEGKEADIGLNYATRGLAVIVSGDPGDMSYTYSAANLTMTLESLMVEGNQVDMAEFGTVRLEIDDIAGTAQMTVGDLRQSSQKITTGALSYLVDFNEPDGGDGRMVVKGSADSMDFRGTFSLPPELDARQMVRMLETGFAFDGKFAIENGASEFDFKDDDEVVKGSTRSATVGLHIAMGQDGMSYGVQSTDVEMSTAGSDLPFPVEVAMAEAAVDMKMPLMANETPQAFDLGLTLGDFTVSDMLWGIFDPAGQLPRDPATVAVDLSGTVRLLANLLDPEQMMAVDAGEAPPGEIETLDIKGLTLRVAGAELTGKGGFTFNNDDLVTFEGMPAPDGEVNLMLVGGNALLDKLVAMGLVPEDQAGGMRMMMGLFAVPGDGEDTLESRIEVKPDGQILANGQRIK
ncbi:DUF2125 domain-containing protein [Roseovarius amoyensis]|uniref:DUF2125 domain-containing protein n=1 Tax=Roseovarius amoyensis TaxID=2211448 RepID=UPI000DBE36EB|nr:DUF2125 domain-containing protein [Roseovarius amoyensis]